jgi:hypothetical protein
MDRRKSLKVMALTAVSAGTLLEACKSTDKKKAEGDPKETPTIDRFDAEKAADEKLMASTFFNEHEMKTIAVLSDIIIPADEISGSATEAKVPDFIEFIVKDKPEFQTPMRGGLRWLDMQSFQRFNKSFTDASAAQRIQIVDEIAYPAKAKPAMKQGVAFFTLIRNLTATGFYTSQMGIKDVGYKGNTPNQWNGVPDEVLKQYGLAYTDKEIKECVSYT